MGKNYTPFAIRIHIGFFGRRNSGKSSLVNAVTGQNLSLVSEIKGTTTDPVYKAMELLPLGPVLIIDTPGIDDEGILGDKRVQKMRQVLNKTDIAVIVLENTEPVYKGENSNFNLCEQEIKLIETIKNKKIPFIMVLNKYDLLADNTPPSDASRFLNEEILPVSAKTGFNINLLKEKIAALVPAGGEKKPLVSDLINPGDFVLLVTHIDKAAPKDRLILPQQQTIRDILDTGAAAIVVKESGLKETLSALGKKPALVITDSQVFAEVSNEVPPEIPLTSFSILFARYKGWLETAIRGAAALDDLKDGDKILICEGCTHHRQCDDIGTVKLPSMIKNYSGKEPVFAFCSGGDFPDLNLSSSKGAYKMIIHCGACMLNDREMLYRRLNAEEQNIPFTNFGITIAHIQGIALKL